MNEEKYLEIANYCASCIKKPCQSGCPLNNDTMGFIKHIKNKDYKSAFDLLCETSVLMPICGRVCPHTKQCEGKCVKNALLKPVEIGRLEAFIGDLAIKNNWKLPDCDINTKYKVAIVGAGPAGLTCAQFLRRKGIDVTIYEKHDYLGGILYHGIPDFRLDKTLLKQWIDKILETGIKVKTNMELGKDFTMESLEKEYDAIFLSFGANISNKMNIKGEDLKGVYGGNEFLENNFNLDLKDKTVIVNGGGNVAMDVSRTIKRNGAKRVIVVYRRGEAEMPAEKKEIQEAKEEEIEFLFQTNILQILGQDKVQQIECIKTELVKKEGETRLSPVNIEGSNFKISCDYVMMAVGSSAEEKVVSKLGLEVDRYGRIITDENGSTSNKKVFAGGDLAGNKATVAFAARAGRDGAEAIISKLL